MSFCSLEAWKGTATTTRANYEQQASHYKLQANSHYSLLAAAILMDDGDTLVN
jgi:hypothetical protein